MPLPKTGAHTTDDIYALPDGKRAELIDGRIYETAPPLRIHQRIVTELGTVINNYIKKEGGTREVNVAPFAVRLNADDKTYVEPDISVVCDPDKLTEKGCVGAPDWIIEVVSPASARMDYMIKLFKYRTAGVREYWIVDIDKDRVTAYDLENDDMGDCTFSDSVKVGIYDGLEIDFSTLGI